MNDTDASSYTDALEDIMFGFRGLDHFFSSPNGSTLCAKLRAQFSSAAPESAVKKRSQLWELALAGWKCLKGTLIAEMNQSSESMSLIVEGAKEVTSMISGLNKASSKVHRY